MASVNPPVWSRCTQLPPPNDRVPVVDHTRRLSKRCYWEPLRPETAIYCFQFPVYCSVRNLIIIGGIRRQSAALEGRFTSGIKSRSAFKCDQCPPGTQHHAPIIWWWCFRFQDGDVNIIFNIKLSVPVLSQRIDRGPDRTVRSGGIKIFLISSHSLACFLVIPFDMPAIAQSNTTRRCKPFSFFFSLDFLGQPFPAQ